MFGEPQSTIPICPCPTCRLIMRKVAAALEGMSATEGREGAVSVRVGFSGYRLGPEWVFHGRGGELEEPIINIGEAI
jgi:hypothetical protein